MDDHIAVALPYAISVMKSLLFSPDQPLTDKQVMSAWEADFAIHSHAIILSDSIAYQALYPDITTTTNSTAQPPSNPSTLSATFARSELLQSMRNMQQKIQTAVNQRVAKMSFKPRLYRLANRLDISGKEIRAFVFIILNCVGIEGPLSGERRSSSHHRSDLYSCRKFADMDGDELLNFLSPSRKHFTQGVLEVEEEFAALYNENKLRAPREVLKAIYGCVLTVDEAMTLGASSLAEVLSEEPGSIIGADSVITPEILPKSIQGITDNHASDSFNLQSRDRNTDSTSMVKFLSELRVEDDNQVVQNNIPEDKTEVDAADHPTMNSKKASSELENGDKSGFAEEEPVVEGDVKPFSDDMDYLKDGFEVVREACKVHNFREKSNDDDRYISTKRPVEALQREANAKFRKAVSLFTRRLSRTTQSGNVLPRLELLVKKLKLVHFERMVILTLSKLNSYHSSVSLISAKLIPLLALTIWLYLVYIAPKLNLTYPKF